MVHTQEVECHLLQTDVTAVQVGPNTRSYFQSMLSTTTGIQAAQSGVPFPTGVRDFSLQRVQTGCGAHLASFSVGVGDFSGGQKAGLRMTEVIPLVPLLAFIMETRTAVTVPHRQAAVTVPHRQTQL
jgi:hypothetical protein